MSAQGDVANESRLSTYTEDHTEYTYTWENVYYRVDTPDGPKDVLKGISGYIEPGTVSINLTAFLCL